jgi:hypothetical protein
MTTDKTISSTLAALAVVSFTNASFGNTTWECKGDLVIDGKTAQTRTGYCHLPYKQTCITFDPELLDYYVNKQSLWSYDDVPARQGCKWWSLLVAD